jgi:hypothetical protein
MIMKMIGSMIGSMIVKAGRMLFGDYLNPEP